MKLVNYFTVTALTLLIKVVCLLVTIAYYTLAERKIMASVQRRLGPNVVGFWGLLQPLADALKLVGKELVIPTHANSRIFVFAPMGVLLCAFLAWAVIPFRLFDHSSMMSDVLVRECLYEYIEDESPSEKDAPRIPVPSSWSELAWLVFWVVIISISSSIEKVVEGYVLTNLILFFQLNSAAIVLSAVGRSGRAAIR